MITANAAGVIKAAMSNTRSRIAAITMSKLDAITPGRAATIARLRRLNAKTTDEVRRVGKRSLQERLLPRKRPLVSRAQEFRALKYWTEYDHRSLRSVRNPDMYSDVSQESTQRCECCTEDGGAVAS